MKETRVLRNYDCPEEQPWSFPVRWARAHLPYQRAFLSSPATTIHDIWKDMFVMAVPVLQKILRPVIIYAFLEVGLRLSLRGGSGSQSV